MEVKTKKEALGSVLDSLTVEGQLYEVVDAEQKKIRCYACAHRCLIKEGRRGICNVRYNEGGILRVPHGYVGALQLDPIEKKPFFHVLPGSDALSFGMLGCDFRCGYCQNWLTSQTLRDDAAGVMPEIISADGLVNLTKRYRAKSLASTYNEPLITSEWAVDVFKPARQAGLKTLYISNGNATKEALQFLVPWVDAYKIDLKTMNDAHYRKHLGGVLQHVLDTIKMAHDMGLWVEIVTLVIPGFNDSNEELWDAARYIRSVSPDIPWHVTAFHPDYKMSDVPHTTINTLLRAAEIGAEAGLNYIYAGNLPGQMQNWEDTRCPTCQTTVIRRWGFKVLENKLGADGTCPSCHTKLPGQWT